MKVVLVMLIMGWLTACYQVGSDASYLNGSFIGYFHNNKTDTTQVSFTFEENTFIRNSKKTLPAICKGTFKPSRETILFVEECNDRNGAHHMKINGLYNYRVYNDGVLTIWKTNEASAEEFVLVRQN